jgi:hypothetical protein
VQILRTIVRFYLAPAHSLPTPWHQVVPFVLLVGTYLLFVRWLMPGFVSVVAFLMSGLIRLCSYGALVPDLISTSSRRARGLPPAGWTFALGDSVLHTEQTCIRALKSVRVAPKRNNRLAVWLMVIVIVVPVFAYFGQKSQTNQGLRQTSQNILEWYGKVDTWTRS